MNQCHFGFSRLSEFMTFTCLQFPCITLVGSVVWLAERHIPSAAPTLGHLFDRKIQDALLTHRTNHLAQKTQTIAKEAQTVNLQVQDTLFFRAVMVFSLCLFLDTVS